MSKPQIRTDRPAQRLSGTSFLAEIKEFGTFSTGAQRYIRRALDIGLERRDAVTRWSRSPAEASQIEAQAAAYRRLDQIRAALPDDISLEAAEPLMAPLISLIGADLAQGRLESFAACRFLYERLIGAAVRPFLPAAFCAAAAMPHLHPEDRRTLLQSLNETAATAAGWSNREPVFFPEWVEKVESDFAG